MRDEVQRVSCGGCRPWTLSKTGHLALPWAAGTSAIQRAGRSVQKWGPTPKPAHRPGNPPRRWLPVLVQEQAPRYRPCASFGRRPGHLACILVVPRAGRIRLSPCTAFTPFGFTSSLCELALQLQQQVRICLRHQRGLEEAQGFVYIRCGHHGRNIQVGRGRGDQSVIQTGQEEAVFQGPGALLHVPIVVHRLRGEVISHQGAPRPSVCK